MTVGQTLKDTDFAMRQRYKGFLHDKVSEMLRDTKEISPEKEHLEVDAFPTEARMRQKAEEKQHRLLTGEKHKPKSRQTEIHPGYDDCGEDTTSLGFHDNVVECYHQEIGPITELDVFLIQEEAALNPTGYF